MHGHLLDERNEVTNLSSRGSTYRLANYEISQIQKCRQLTVQKKFKLGKNFGPFRVAIRHCFDSLKKFVLALQ